MITLEERYRWSLVSWDSLLPVFISLLDPGKVVGSLIYYTSRRSADIDWLVKCQQRFDERHTCRSGKSIYIYARSIPLPRRQDLPMC